jgi:hypothetical protein
MVSRSFDFKYVNMKTTAIQGMHLHKPPHPSHPGELVGDASVPEVHENDLEFNFVSWFVAIEVG